MKIVYERPKTLEKVVNHYCPGCHHGILHALIAEVLDEMNLADKTVGVAPVGCAVMAYNYLDIDWIEAPHGRAVAIATALNWHIQTFWCLPIKETEMRRRLVSLRRFMAPFEE